MVTPGLRLWPDLFSVHTVQITGEMLVGKGGTLAYADDILVYRQGKMTGSELSRSQEESHVNLEQCLLDNG